MEIGANLFAKNFVINYVETVVVRTRTAKIYNTESVEKNE